MLYSFPRRVKQELAEKWQVGVPDRLKVFGGNIFKFYPKTTLFVEKGLVYDSFAIGTNSYTGSNLKNCCCGNYCSIADNVVFTLPRHPVDRITTSPVTYRNARCTPVAEKVRRIPVRETLGPVQVGHDVWIGYHATIMDGVSIGNGAVVGAHSVVTKDVPPYSIVAGVPAKVIRYRFEPSVIQAIEASRWWEYDLSEWDETVDWDNLEETLEKVTAAIRTGRLRKIDPEAYISEKMLKPFATRTRFYFKWSEGEKMLKLFGIWLCCKLKPLDIRVK